MFFPGDASTRKRVDLGGRSTKERDRQKLLEQTRLERNRRTLLRQQNSAALKIQKCFRGRRAVECERSAVRSQFLRTFGRHCQNANWFCFQPESDFLRQFLFFYKPKNESDFVALIKICRFLHQFSLGGGDIVSLFTGGDYVSSHALVDFRLKNLTYACIYAVYKNRFLLKDQLWMSPGNSDASVVILLEALTVLLDPKLPWVCKLVGYLVQKDAFALLRDVILPLKECLSYCSSNGRASSLEQLLSLIIAHTGKMPCSCPETSSQCCFSSQILTIPFLWHLFPRLKEVFAAQNLSQYYIHQMASHMQNNMNVLPDDVSPEFPGYACILGNILEIAPVVMSDRSCSFELPANSVQLGIRKPLVAMFLDIVKAVDLTAATTFLLKSLPSIQSVKESVAVSDDEMTMSDEIMVDMLDKELEKQISSAIDPRFLLQLTNVLFSGISFVGASNNVEPNKKEVIAVSVACAFLQVTLETLPLERIMTVLAYRTELVPVLWSFIKWCHESQKWSSVSEQFVHIFGDAPGWLLPLSVFCPVYKHMLMIIDNEEFYEQEKPLSLKDIRSLIIILRQALWQLLWVNPTSSNSAKSTNHVGAHKNHPLESIQHRVIVVAAELLSQLQDWNNRRQFTPPSDFHADGVNEHFISEASTENTRAREILKVAPFLVPFTSRAKIFTSQLAASRQRDSSHAVFSRNRFRIRRDHILEDAYNQLSALSDEDLRGQMRVSFVNQLGVEEAGIDGGGIFKDFMENISRAAFDVQYGLFKETADHLLYPNPASGMIHEQHLQFFHFLGTILAKAMFEGILVDIPFATFFLSKLKQKHNYLNDLPSLDPELYRHLIFLKHYKGDLSGLELYFVIINNEYGEQREEELLQGGKNLRVTNENVITFIHLVANHRLNFQIRQQSSHFLRGFQQLIQKDWIDMFNEHELQLLISGSIEGLDIDDLRRNTNYAGGYHKDHYVIDMFWEVVKGLSLENQRNFLKFVTGCSRGPLLGFRYLEPLFCVQRAAGDASEEALSRLPTSATCMNLLKLPPYRSKEQMEMKILYAINAEAGFDLS